MFTFTCPFCRQELEAEDSWEGQIAECPNCGKQVEIKRPQRFQNKLSHIANASHSAPTLPLDYKRNIQYFRLVSFVDIAAAVTGGFGLVMLIWAISLKDFSYMLISIISLGLSFFIVRKFILSRPTDAEIDAQALVLHSKLRAKALLKLGIEEEEISIATPIELWGYSFGKSQLNNATSLPLRDVKGKDGVWRSPEVILSAFYFSENTVHYYRWVASLVSDSFRESTDEIFYRDIVSVKMDSEESPAYNRKTGKAISGKLIRFDSFSIRNMGGESISCTVRDSSEAEQAVNGMRALLKQKKNS